MLRDLRELIYKYNRGFYGNAEWSKEAKKEDIITLFAISSKMQKKLEALFNSNLKEEREGIIREVLNDLPRYSKSVIRTKLRAKLEATNTLEVKEEGGI